MSKKTISKKRIEVTESGVHVHDFDIPVKDVADYFQRVPEQKRETEFRRAIEVGVFCLERASTGMDLEFVKRQVQSLLANVDKTVGKIPGEVQKELVAKIGADKGQVLEPIQVLINEVSKVLKVRIDDVNKLLSGEIDPSKQSSTLGKALKEIKNLLDPKRKDSVQSSIQEATDKITSKDGALTSAVKSVVSDSVKPLADEVDKLTKEIRGQEAAKEALEQTIQKGTSYEDVVVESLQKWSSAVGAEVHHVGTDNRPGDILFKVPSTSSFAGEEILIVIEAKDQQTPAGRKVIGDSLRSAMAERSADAAIYLSRSPNGFAKEIGEWGEGHLERGPYVATIHEQLTIAIRWLIVQRNIAALQSVKPDVDVGTVTAQIARIRTSLKHIKNIKSTVSSLNTNATKIGTEADHLRREIGEALSAMEEAIQVASGEAEPLAAE